ncbi:MAG TPA: alpha/beta hydrolase, partial [Thermoleophilia bacterium]|nr:alpha/beta hydrolase [Thermoleophilia bacterium]
GTTADNVAVHYPRWPRRELELRARWLETCSEAAVAESHQSFERELFPPLWSAVQAHATLVYGTESPVVVASDIPTLAAANPAATLLGVGGAGHMIPWDQPDLTIALLRALIHPLALTELGHGASAPERIST